MKEQHKFAIVNTKPPEGVRLMLWDSKKWVSVMTDEDGADLLKEMQALRDEITTLREELRLHERMAK